MLQNVGDIRPLRHMIVALVHAAVRLHSRVPGISSRLLVGKAGTPWPNELAGLL